MGFAALVGIVNHGSYCGHWREVCVNCGARSDVHHFSWHGIGGSYGRRTEEGPISKWVQASEGRQCCHAWKPTTGSGGAVLAGHASFLCKAFGLERDVYGLECFSSECIDDVLENRLNDDAKFLTKFKKYVFAGERDEPTFYQDLYDSLLACDIPGE